MKVLILTTLGALFGIGAAPAQTAPVVFGQITGVMRDSATGAPIIRGVACGDFPPAPRGKSATRCGSTGEGGHYLIDSVPSGTFSISAVCTGSTVWDSRPIAHQTIVVASGTTVEWNIDAATAACDQRPMERIRGRFNGLYYNPDVETSWFFADGRTDQLAWANFGHSVSSPDVWRSVKGTKYGLGCVRVTFAGTMHGPINGGGYAFAVDTIVSAKQVPREDCFKIVEHFLPFVRSIHPRGG